MANPLRRLFDPGDWLAVQPRLDPAELTLRLDYRPDPSAVRLRLLAGVAVMAIVAAVVYFVEDDFGRFVACGFGFFGLLNVVYGVLQSGFEMSLAITPDEVKVRRKGLLGEERWSEPLSAYNGVRLRERQVRRQSVGTIESSKRYQIIELAHDRPERTVPLYVTDGADSPRAIQEAFAERFRLPALIEDLTRGDIASRATGDEPAADPGPPPSGVSLDQDGETTRISVGLGGVGRTLVPVFYLGVAALFGFVGYQIEPVAGAVAAGMALLLFAVMFGVSRLLGGDQRSPAICLTDERVWIDRPKTKIPAFIGTIRSAMQDAVGGGAPALQPVVESLPLKAIERIRVDRYVSHNDSRGPSAQPRLLIEAEAGRLEFMASQFDEKKLAWVRRYLEWRIGDY